MLGTEPVEEEVPITREDLGWETQFVFYIYDKLPAKWEGFSGQYMGKELLLLPVLFDQYEVEDYIRKYAWDIIPVIDSFVAEDVAKKIKSKTKGDMASGKHHS